MSYRKIYIAFFLVGLFLPAPVSAQDTLTIAYGEIVRKDVISAVSAISGSEFTLTPVISVDNALTGRLQGVITVTQPDQPGNEWVEMYVRGLHTSSENRLPILLVDNVEREFSQLNLNEIESVTVLKDASALAIYGGRGANGVILVTTKRGKNSGKQELQLHLQGAIVQPTRLPEFLNSYDYARLFNEAYALDGYPNPRYTAEEIEGYRKVVAGESDANRYRYPDNNYYEEALRTFSWQQNYDLSMRGGNDFARYFVLVGYLQQDGLYKYKSESPEYSSNTNYRRFNFRTNVDMNISQLVTAGLDMAGRLEYRHQPGANSAQILNLMAGLPANAYSILNANGSLGGTPTYQNNLYGMINRTGYTDDQRRIFNATAYAKVDLDPFVKGLSLTARGGFDFYNEYIISRTIAGYKIYELQPDDGSGEDRYFSFGEDQTMSESNSIPAKNRNFVLQFSGNYARTFNKVHNVSALVNFDLINTGQYNGIFGVVPNYKTVAWGGRFGYNYLHKYYAELSAGYSGTEVYAPESRFRFYPAAAFGWTVSEEDFLKGNDILSYLKIRGSYGKVGLDRIGGRTRYGMPTSRFQYRDTWGEDTGYTFGSAYTSQMGAAEQISPNNQLHGETAILSNIGLDAGLLKNKLYLTADVFKEKRNDIFIQRYADIPGIFGAGVPVENLGQVNSWGMEGGLMYKQKVNNDFSFYAGANFIRHDNKVINLYEAEEDAWRMQKNHPMGQQMGFVNLGFFKDEEDIANSPSQAYLGTIRPGDLKYKDMNEDGIIDDRDLTYIGSSAAIPRYLINLDLGFTWKGFEWSALLQGADKDSFMPGELYLPFSNGQGNATKYAYDAWTPETSATAKYPRLTTLANTNNAQNSDFWVRDGSYIRLKSLVIAYNLPESALKTLGLQGAKIYLSGYNLLTIDGVKDFDPEAPYWTAFWNYPNNRTFSLGLNLTF
ncbi:MAG: TonB-dependent receptor [Candidatus Symbiothrix sp.]|jgi:TonB-linked SusC/RagA family outer membrane protein|nr:TonB-dependent receptor [Candidatus Symbiothrix sp.]